MKLFKIQEGTAARLVNVEKQTEQPFVTRKELLLDCEDILFDPVSVYNQTKQIISEYGIMQGDIDQRAKYVLIVPAIFVEIQIEDDE
jgi:hypothetical protein